MLDPGPVRTQIEVPPGGKAGSLSTTGGGTVGAIADHTAELVGKEWLNHSLTLFPW
jgi:hypothetical protein